MLRIHQPRLARGDAEKLRVELIDRVDEGAQVGPCVQSTVRRRPTAPGGQRLSLHPTGQGCTPVLLDVPRPGEPGGHADDRHEVLLGPGGGTAGGLHGDARVSGTRLVGPNVDRQLAPPSDTIHEVSYGAHLVEVRGRQVGAVVKAQEIGQCGD